MNPEQILALKMLSCEIPQALSTIPLAQEESSTILYCVLWHRGRTFKQRGHVEIKDRPHLRKMAAILRVADPDSVSH